MPPAESPTLRRWELAGQLRALREGAGLSLEDVAGHLLCDASKISRIETANRGASLRDVRDLCELYGVDAGQQEHLMELVRQAKQQGWWQGYDEVSSRSATYIGLEDAAVAIRSYETVRVHGLLQTPDYTRSLMRRIIPGLTNDAVEQFVATRQARFEKILKVAEPPSFWVIIDEAVLARQVGGPAVMRSQIEHLIACVADRLVILQVVPFEAGAHAGMEGSFTILEFANGTLADVVYIEGRSGQLYLNRPFDLKVFRETLDYLRASAASPDDSEAILKRLAASPKK